MALAVRTEELFRLCNYLWASQRWLQQSKLWWQSRANVHVQYSENGDAFWCTCWECSLYGCNNHNVENKNPQLSASGKATVVIVSLLSIKVLVCTCLFPLEHDLLTLIHCRLSRDQNQSRLFAGERVMPVTKLREVVCVVTSIYGLWSTFC